VRVLLAVATCLLALPAWSARLPFRAYGAAEGLDGSFVKFVMQDSRGFLWAATNAGVSRFDGHEFRNYGTADGLPAASARKIVEAPDGTLFVLCRQRLARRTPLAASVDSEFEAVNPRGLAEHVGEILDVVVAPDGTLVVAGERGVARLAGDRVAPVELGAAARAAASDATQAWAAAFDGSGALWVARTFGITRVGADGVPRTLALSRDAEINSGWGWLPSMTVDRSGRVWLLTVDRGAWRLDVEQEGLPVVAEVIDRASGLGGFTVRAFHESPDGAIWVGTGSSATTRFERTASGRRATAVGRPEGLPDDEVNSIITDAQGNLWLGTSEAGLVRLANDGLTSWSADEGLRPAIVRAIVDDPDGGVDAIVGDFDVARVFSGRVEAPWRMRGVLAGWGSVQLIARGGDGRLWVATQRGLASYPPGTRLGDLRSRAPATLVGREQGLLRTEVHRLFAARDGTVWFGLMHVRDGVCRLEAGDRVRCFGPGDGLADPAEASAFVEDAEGNLWAGCYQGGVYRYRDGRWESWNELSPQRQRNVASIRRDRAGRLWVAGSPGLVRVDDAGSAHPSFRRYTQQDGLSGADTLDVAEDRFGRIYASGQRGIDRFDLKGGAVRRYTPADGLPSERVAVLHADAEGDIWAGTIHGIARLHPVPEGTHPPPRVYVTSTTVAGKRRAAAGALDFGSDERTVEFGFTSPSFRAGETMRFQWRLLGGEDAWSAPRTSRTIVLAGLSPRAYRFDVRALDGEGSMSEPASMDFRIRPPFWQRGWFLATSAIVLAGVIAALHRARVAGLLELERVRTRIATDLHDDVGTSLSQIAVLSQFASRQAARGGDEVKGSLARITELSGSVVDAMSDVVWSINPARDRMSDLVHRMRRFAVDLFSDTEVALTLDLPADDADESLSPEVRRQVFLVFKEALRNAARYAKASAVSVSFRRDRDGLVLLIADDGRGIGSSAGSPSSTGLGLENMVRRASAIGGAVEIGPGSSGGTLVRLRIPVSGRRYLSKWTGTGGNAAS
jgi:signal transduction histidine kinase/ligand-binding sensor domain-containing protein